VLDPFDTFQLPFELRRLLSEHERQMLKDKILEIQVRLKMRDSELEDNRGRGLHLWRVFDAIAIRLQHQANFKEDLVPRVIPEFIEQIRSDLSWYPHNYDGDLRTYYLAPPITYWQNVGSRLVDHDGGVGGSLETDTARHSTLAPEVMQRQAIEPVPPSESAFEQPRILRRSRSSGREERRLKR
jgi:hypothetical protein